MISYWPADDSVEWLDPIDFVVAATLAESFVATRQHPQILEVGVWKGGWSLTLAKNVPEVILTGIDPYPGLDEIRERLLQTVDGLALNDRFALHGSWAELKASSSIEYDIIHIDGEHTEAGAELDLAEAETMLAEHGVIIVDDIAHPYFPGIASATYRFLEKSGFAMFVYSRNKAYICRLADHAHLFETMRVRLAATPLVIERHFEEFETPPPPYFQSPAVVGQPLLLTVSPGNWAIANDMVHQNSADPMPVVVEEPISEPEAPKNASALRTFARNWLPPKIHAGIAAAMARARA